MSGDMAARMHEASGEFDVTALLPKVTVPTLVLSDIASVAEPA